MKANELRIWNIVGCKISNDAGIYRVLGIPYWGYNGQGDGKEPLILIDRCPKQLVPESKIKSIPLTEEWLLRFGFEKNIDSELLEDEWGILSKATLRRGLAVSPWEEDEKFWFVRFREDVGCRWDDLNEIQYVHQLQNLYFALTGEELEYNP